MRHEASLAIYVNDTVAVTVSVYVPAPKSKPCPAGMKTHRASCLTPPFALNIVVASARFVVVHSVPPGNDGQDEVVPLIVGTEML